MSLIRIIEFDYWMESIFDSRQAIRISGGFRGSFSAQEAPVDLLELDGRFAHTVRILIPPKPSKQSTPGACSFTEEDRKWWEGWTTIFVASSLISPIVDPVRWADLLVESKRIRFCCDTNALCHGTVSWLLTALNGKAD